MFVIGPGMGRRAAGQARFFPVTFWLLAVVFLYSVCDRRRASQPPDAVEGGLYEWAKLGFGDRMGSGGMESVALRDGADVVSEVGGQGETNLSYATGIEWIAESSVDCMASLVILGGTRGDVTIGLARGRKWTAQRRRNRNGRDPFGDDHVARGRLGAWRKPLTKPFECRSLRCRCST